jgi:hypothetical protein
MIHPNETLDSRNGQIALLTLVEYLGSPNVYGFQYCGNLLNEFRQIAVLCKKQCGVEFSTSD